MPVLRALKVGLVIERANRKNLVALVAVAIIVFGFMFYLKAQAVGNQIVEKRVTIIPSRLYCQNFK